MEVEKKIVEMQKYIPCLRLLIESLQRDPLKAHQVKKMKMLMDMLTKHENSKSIKLETLIKCEGILMKVYGKGKDPPPMNAVSEEHSRNKDHKEEKLRRERKREQKERRRMERREQELKYLNRLAKKRRKNLEEKNPDKEKIVNGNSTSCNATALILKIKQEKMDYDEKTIRNEEADVKKEEQNVQSVEKDLVEKTEAEKRTTKIADVDNIKKDVNSDEKSDKMKAAEENTPAVVKEDVNLKEESVDEEMSQPGTDSSEPKTEPVKKDIQDVKNDAEKSVAEKFEAEKSEAEKPEVSASINKKPNDADSKMDIDEEIEKTSSKLTDTDTHKVIEAVKQGEIEKPKEIISSKIKDEIVEKSEDSAEPSKSGFVDLTSDDSSDEKSSGEKNSLEKPPINNESNSKQVEAIKLPQLNPNDKPATVYLIKNKTESSTSGNIDEYDGPPNIMTIDLLDSDSDGEGNCKSLKCDTPNMKMPTPKIICRPIDRFNDRPMFTISSVQSMNANQPESEERREVEKTVSAIVKSIQYTCHHTVPYKYNGLVRSYLEKFVRDLMIEKNRVNLCLQKLQKSVSSEKFKEIKKIIQTYCSEPVSDPNMPTPSPFSHRIKVYPEKLQDVMRQLFFTNNVITVIGYKVYSLVNSPVSYLNGLTQSKSMEINKTLLSTGVQSQITKKSPCVIGLQNSSKSSPSFGIFNANTDLLSPLKSELVSSAEKQKVGSAASGSNSKNRRRKRSDDDDDESYIPHGCKDSGSDDSAQAAAEPVRRVSLQRASKLRCQRYLALEKAMENDEYILRHENAFRDKKSTDSTKIPQNAKTPQRAKIHTAPKTPQAKTPENMKTPQIANSTQKRPCSYGSTRSKRARGGGIMSQVKQEDEEFEASERVEVPDQFEAGDEENDQSNDQMQPDNEESAVDREVEDEEGEECEPPPEIDTSKVNDGKNIVRAYHCRSKYLDKCLICHEKVARKSSAVSHYVNVHRDREVMVSRLTKADITQLLTQSVNFAFLSSSKSSQNTYLATCIFCKRQMTCSLRFWLEHYTSHTGEFGYQCSNCTVRRSVKQQAKRHVNFECKTRSPKIKMVFELEISATEINAYVCLLCNYIQLQQENLLNHLQTEHELSQGHVTDAHYRLVNLLSVTRPYFDEFNQSIDNYGNVVNPDSLEYFNTQQFVDAHFNEQKVDGDDMSFMICNMLATDEDHQLNIPDDTDVAGMAKNDGEKIMSVEAASEEVQVTPDNSELTTVAVDVEISEITDNADPVIVENSNVSTGSHDEEAIVLERAESAKFSKGIKAVEDGAIENNNETEISEALETNEEKLNQLDNEVAPATESAEILESEETAESTLSKNNDKPTVAEVTETLESPDNADSTLERATTPIDSGELTGAATTDTSESAPIREIVAIPTMADELNKDKETAAESVEAAECLEDTKPVQKIENVTTDYLESIGTEATTVAKAAGTSEFANTTSSVLNEESTTLKSEYSEGGKSLEGEPTKETVKERTTYPELSDNRAATASEVIDSSRVEDSVKAFDSLEATDNAEVVATSIELNNEAIASEPVDELEFSDVPKSVEGEATVSNAETGISVGPQNDKEASESPKSDANEATITTEAGENSGISEGPQNDEEATESPKSDSNKAAAAGISEGPQNDEEATESPKSVSNKAAAIAIGDVENSGISESPQNDEEATESLKSVSNKAAAIAVGDVENLDSAGEAMIANIETDISEARETNRGTTHYRQSICDEQIAIADHVENSQSEDNVADGPSSIAVKATTVTGSTENSETADNTADCSESNDAEATIVAEGCVGFPENSEAESKSESTALIVSDKSCNGEVSAPQPSETMDLQTMKITTPEISGPLTSDVEMNNVEG